MSRSLSSLRPGEKPRIRAAPMYSRDPNDICGESSVEFLNGAHQPSKIQPTRKAFMHKRQFVALVIVLPILLCGCSHKEQTTTNSSSSEGGVTSETATTAPASAEAVATSLGKTPVTFN